MNSAEVKELIHRELPHILQTDRTFHYVIQDMLQEKFAGKQKTEDRFDQVLAEIRALREESQRKWDESQRKWDEQQAEIRALREESQRKWDEQQSEIRALREESQQILKEVQLFIRKYDSSIGAIGSRWGLSAEQSFRSALGSILEESFGVRVLNITESDHEGEVFGHPDQIELDIIIKNGLLIICEIKSSMSKNDMYIFGRKVRFYEKHHDTEAARQIVISPMVDRYARPVAEKLGIEVFSHAEDVDAGT